MYYGDRLKSDHFGIEINYPTLGTTTVAGLKSDHFGIEMPQRPEGV